MQAAGCQGLVVATGSLYLIGPLRAAALASQGKHTPFAGYELTGRVRATIVGGHLAFER